MPTFAPVLRLLHVLSVAALVALAASVQASLAGEDADRDGDGLSDFQEIHKYRTDPDRRDSDGDGTPDGERDERREYTYSVRTVLRVVPPVNEAHLCDDYQDARVLKKTPQYYELEVIHYPLSTAGDEIGEDANWRETIAELKGDGLQSGPSVNWDATMRRDLETALAADGIHIDRLTDREVVLRVSEWVLRNTRAHDNFNGFHVYFPDGVATPYPGREQSIEHDKTDASWTIAEQLEREVLGRQMFYHRMHGTCTSTAVLMTTVMRAAGIPARMVLCTPVVDASGGDNLELIRKGVTHHRIREIILSALAPLAGSNASHTFNEVYVDGRWRRLNYSRLGQKILDRGMFGLVTHVNTFYDLADTDLVNWGGREPDDVFKYENAYTAVEVSDHFGAHAEVPNPPATATDIKELRISKVRWAGSDKLPECVDPDNFKYDGSGHLLLHVDEPLGGAGGDDYGKFYEAAPKRFVLRAKDQPDIPLQAERGYWLNSVHDAREFYARISPEDMPKMKPDLEYTLAPAEDGKTRWTVAPKLRVKRPERVLDCGYRTLTIAKLRWLEDPGLPDAIDRGGFDRDGSGHLFLSVEQPAAGDDADAYRRFWEAVDRKFRLVAAGNAAIPVAAERGYWINPNKNCREFYVRIPADEMKKLAGGAEYRLEPGRKDAAPNWKVAPGVTIGPP